MGETGRRLSRRAGYVSWPARCWTTGDDRHSANKKARRDAILAWAQRDPSILVVFQDESWFSGTPKAVGQYGQRGVPRTAAVAKPAHKCKGAWVLYAALEVLTGQVQRFYAPRCNQTFVRQQLETLLAKPKPAGKRGLVGIWANASALTPN